MRFLPTQEANKYLAKIGMRVGDWNQIAEIEDNNKEGNNWVNYPAPKNAQELFNFAQHAAGWLPQGEWKILQIDNSTCLDAVQEDFISRLLFGPDCVRGLNDCRTLLFEFGRTPADERKTELLISDLIFAFLLFEGHAHVVSSKSEEGARLGIQDGAAYFSSREKTLHGAKALLEKFSRNPSMSPSWIVDILVEGQK